MGHAGSRLDSTKRFIAHGLQKRDLTGDKLLQEWKKHGAKFLVIISYAWLSKEHPDPDSFHLKRLVRILRELKNAQSQMTGGQVDELGVIIDFCALWQNRGGAVDSRTELQFKEFKDGLKEINTPYAHQDITAVKLRPVPGHVLRKYAHLVTFIVFSRAAPPAACPHSGDGGCGVVAVMCCLGPFWRAGWFSDVWVMFFRC